jgi:hypothetical protein
MKTSEAKDKVLNYLVAKCEGAYNPSVDTDIDGTKRVNYGGMYPEWSTDWAHGGPIIEREKINLGSVLCDGREFWTATMYLAESEGPTPLVAAMRCYVASKLGDDVEIPEELK